ncbi:WD40 repeat domain-containing protein [Sporomusa termitida]|uniref:WD domain, G-beta repeat n=1 Tax=Sporomusa termitida TaxID=2377 RepID=A0A517E0U5_9FIRM|nr:hypothetical protein [Sporomusa termitida]QDR83220.1 WD domain, G-beta repeat [Sporomusa termitida]
MALGDDDKEFLRQLTWIYPSEYVAELKELAEAVITEQLAAGERQNIRDIIWGIMAKIRAEAEGGSNTAAAAGKAASEAVQAEADREIRDNVQAALSAGQLHIPAGMGPEVIIPLVAALAEPAIGAGARSVLCQLSDSGAIDALCGEWAKTRSPELEQIIMKTGYLAAHPLGVRLLTVLKTKADRVMLAEGTELVPELLAAVDDPDRSIAGSARRLLLTLTNRQAVDTVCETVLADPDNERLQAWAVMAGYAPADDSRAALYYAITGQWDKYYALDWQEDRPLLARGYSEASLPERRRFLAAARKSGQGLLLTGLLLAGNGQDEYEEITAADWESLLDLLASQQRWPDLYRLVFRAPAQWAGEITLLLKNSGWQPGAWAQRGWERSLAACPQSGRNAFVPDGRELIALAFDQAEIEAMAFHPNKRIAAGGGRDGRLRLWQLGSQQIWRTVDLHAEAITAVAFTPDGRYLATAGREGRVHIWQLPAVKWVSSVCGQPGLVTAMAAGAGGAILAAACAGGLAAARVWDWDGAYMTNQGQYPGSWFQAAAVSAEQRLAVGGGRDGIIRLYPLTGSKQGKLCWAAHAGAVQALKLSGDGNFLVSTGADGLLKIWQTASGKLLWTLPAAGRLLAVSADGALAAISNPGRRNITIKQLRLVKPLAQATHADWQHAGQLLAAAALEPEAGQAVAFLQTILDSKFCYDIRL